MEKVFLNSDATFNSIDLGVPTSPQSTVNTTLPINWDKVTADYTPVDSTALHTDISAAAALTGLKVIELDKDTTYTGQFEIDNSAVSTSEIVFRSSEFASLPSGIRVGSGDAANLAKVISASTRAIEGEYGTHDIYLVGLEVTTSDNSLIDAIVSFPPGTPTQESDICNQIIIDRCWIHGELDQDLLRGVRFHADNAAIINTTIDRVVRADAGGNDISIGISAWYSHGPQLYENCLVEAAGINAIFNEDTSPNISGDMLSDVTVRRCHFHKPLTWKEDDASFSGIDYDVKNLFELKSGQRYLVEDCVFENCWRDPSSDQQGYGVILSPRAHGHTTRTVSDFHMRYCRISNTAMGVQCMVQDTSNPTDTIPIERWTFEHNEIVLDPDINYPAYGLWRAFIIAAANGTGVGDHIRINNNTIYQVSDGRSIVWVDRASEITPVLNHFEFNNNIAHHGDQYGIGGSSDTIGDSDGSLAKWFTNPIAIGNEIIEYDTDYSAQWPGNTWHATEAAVGFTNAPSGDYSISPYANVGCDIATLNTRLTGVI